MKLIQLVGDIGGTKTTLAVLEAEKDHLIYLDKVTYPSADYPSLEALIAHYLHGKKWPIVQASFGIAGPVVAGYAQVTNLPWKIEETSLSKGLGFPAYLLNDLAAIAHAVPFLEKEDVQVLNSSVPALHGPLAIIAPGTGLGEAYMQWNGDRYRSYASEGGHVDFAPTNAMQMRLLAYLLERYEHVSYERVCSGMGLPNLYAFLKESQIYPEPEWLHRQIIAAADPVPIISQAALDGKAEIAVATLDLFVSILGSEAGNLALKILATGGVYLGGGIPRRIVPFLKKELFLRAFEDKGRFSNLLNDIPVYLIHNPDVALIGAARHGLEPTRKLG